MNNRGTDHSEALRRLNQGKTLYKRLVERHRREEGAYEAKLAELQARVDELESE
jgi:hypothetical protein